MGNPTEYDQFLAGMRDVWSARAEEWDTRAEANRTAPDRPADLDRTAAALRLEPGSRLLDAGCGTGQFALEFAALGCIVTAIDVAPAMIERARAHGAERQLEVEWRVGDLSSLPDPAASYDAILARVSLQFVPNPWVALQELRRVIRPGGRLYVSVPGARSPIYRERWRRFAFPDEALANGILPWELETLLHNDDWTVLDGWGEFGADMRGNQNPLSAADVGSLDLRLQQAAATIWTFIARPGDPAATA
ncbi:MAG: methyltransferase domain-containing protein [Chloroflexota bacterium]|nr:methyltransferase domain-containing protein [Chloroflexota bacterium]